MSIKNRPCVLPLLPVLLPLGGDVDGSRVGITAYRRDTVFAPSVHGAIGGVAGTRVGISYTTYRWDRVYFPSGLLSIGGVAGWSKGGDFHVSLG